MLITQLVYKEKKNMKKTFILVLMALVGVSLFLSGVRADSARTIPMKFGVALSTNKVVVANAGTIYKITGRATSANASYVVYNHATGQDGTNTNIIAEGGEATQYDSFDTLDFGSEGLDFNAGLYVVTTTCDVAILYR